MPSLSEKLQRIADLGFTYKIRYWGNCAVDLIGPAVGDSGAEPYGYGEVSGHDIEAALTVAMKDAGIEE